jgi:trigger factor
MKYTLKKNDNSTVTLTIEVEQKELEKHRIKAAEDISKELKIDGFRPGKVPLDVVEKNVDKKYIDAQTMDIAIQVSYAEAAMKEKLQVIAQPKIKFLSDTTKSGEPLKFEAEVAIMPEVKVKEYKSIKVPKEDVKVEKKEIEEALADLKKYFKDWKDVDRAAKKGDRVELDFEGFEPKDDSPIEGTASKNHPVILGDNTLIPGFEEHVEGMKKDEKKEFELTFPKDYHKKDFSEKKIKFKVELKRIEAGEDPEINEAFAEKLTGKKLTPAELEKDIENNIKAKKSQRAEMDRENKFLEKILENTEVNLPDTLVDEEVEYMVHDMRHDLQNKGVKDFNEFLEKNKTTIEDLKKKYKPEAEKRIKVRLALTHIIEEEKIEVEDKEVDEELKKMEMLGKKPNSPEEEQQAKAQLKNKLVLKKLFDKLLG